MEELRYRYFVTTLITIAILALLGWLLSLWTPKDSAEVASWVQALGSIGAIIGSFALVRYQTAGQDRRDADRNRKAAQEIAKVGIAFLADARAAVGESTKYIAQHQAGTQFQCHTDRLTDAQAGLRGLAARELPMLLLSQVIMMQRYVTYSIRAVAQRNGTSPTLTSSTRVKAQERDQKAADVLAAALKQYKDIP